MSNKKRRISIISLFHYFKLVFRSALFISVLVIYIVHRVTDSLPPFGEILKRPPILAFIWIIFVVEMILRFFPSSHIESMGCQKQFKRNFIPTEETNPGLNSWRSTLAVAIAWVILNGVIGVLYYTDIIDAPILIIISLAYSVCDMICILFFCPFQTWFMKNKCCGSCRIYNWDYAMMFTPLVFIPDPFTWSLLGISLALLVTWEVLIRVFPERFSERTNHALSCANCKEKLCHHKVQLRHFLKKNNERLRLKGNTVIEKAKKHINERRKK